MKNLIHTRMWLSTELNTIESDSLKDYLKKNNITFETSAVGVAGLVHFEVFCDEIQARQIDRFIDTL